MMVEAVVFDFYGTLTAGRSEFAQSAARSAQAAALGVNAVEYDRALSETYRERFRGATGGVRESLAWVAARLGKVPDEASLIRAEQVRIATERQFAEPRPEVVSLLQRLQAGGLRIGLISDCTAELPKVFEQLPIAELVDTAVFSCVTGQVKPDPSNYLSCCEELGVLPQRCVYVGDGGSDELAGAARVGMHPVHLDVVGERGGVVYGRHDTWPGDVIGSLLDVEPLLHELADHPRSAGRAAT